jgi:hypothetical protein
MAPFYARGMSSDAFADLAASLDGFAGAVRATMNRHRMPLEGSPALKEADGEPFAGEWGSDPSLEIFGVVYLTAWSCMDHLAALAAVLRANCGVAASYTMARGACEPAAVSCYLSDEVIGGRERIRRSLNCYLTALWEQIRLLEPLRPADAAATAAKARESVARICREGARQGFTVSKMTDRAAACLDDKMPGVMKLIDACASAAPGFGETSYRLLSAIAHGQLHGLSRFMMTGLPGPRADPGAAPGQMNVPADVLARELLVVPASADAAARSVCWFAGWDATGAGQAASRMHFTWSRISGVPYAGLAMGALYGGSTG